MKILERAALAALLILPGLDVVAEEIVLPPSQAEIDAFNACLRKGPMPCVLPTRTVIVPDDGNLLPDERMTPMPERRFYQAPPDELVSGSANAELRDDILNARGYRTYKWWIIRTQDGPPEPFGSYSQDRGGSDPGGSGPDSTVPSDSPSDRDRGDREGRSERSEPNCKR